MNEEPNKQIETGIYLRMSIEEVAEQVCTLCHAKKALNYHSCLAIAEYLDQLTYDTGKPVVVSPWDLVDQWSEYTLDDAVELLIDYNYDDMDEVAELVDEGDLEGIARLLVKHCGVMTALAVNSELLVVEHVV